MSKLIKKILDWCPINKIQLNQKEETWVSKNILLFILIVSLITYGGAYILFLKPEPTPESVVVTIDGVEITDDELDYYNFTGFHGKKVAFEIPIETDEFASPGTNEYEKQIYTFDDWDEAFTVLDEMNVPKIVLVFAKWLENGTHLEVAERYFGSLEAYYGYQGSTGSISHYLGTNIRGSTSFFNVERAQEIYPIFYELGTSERIVIEKMYSGPSTDGPIWIYAVELSDSPPYTVLMIKFTRR